MQHCSIKMEYSLRLLIIIGAFLTGIYYEYSCALLSAALLLWLIIFSQKSRICVKKNSASLAVGTLFAFALLSPLWAVDHGMSLFGATKIFTMLLFSICMMQMSSEQRQHILFDVPIYGGIMVVVSYLLQFITPLTDSFVVSGRLGGFFQYPNTFACFLLIGIEVVLFENHQKQWIRMLEGAVLTFGFLQAGSRAAFLIGVVSVTICMICKKEKKDNLVFSASMAVGVLIHLLISMLSKATASEHMLDISTNTSTFLGRILYWKDALPIVLKHPFGIGYMGYYFSQGTFQNGVYSVQWIHNDLLQILLDYGWIPTFLVLAALWRSFRSKQVRTWQKIVVGTVLAHALFDFDFEYILIALLVLTVLDWDEGKSLVFKNATVPTVVLSAFTIVSIWLGSSNLLYLFGSYADAVKVYRGNTMAQMELLSEDHAAEEAMLRADQILKMNTFSSVGWNVKAAVCCKHCDYLGMISAKKEAISHDKYSINEYTDYFDKLYEGMQFYESQHQLEYAQRFKQEILQIPNMLEEVSKSTDKLAWKIVDVPQLQLPNNYQEYINSIS